VAGSRDDLEAGVGQPIKDQTGAVRFEDGHEITFEEFVAWNWFVEGVEGKLPG